MDPPASLRVAVVGSGPSGFYAAEALLSAPAGASVDLYDRLPTPFGLVRYGVAPDHQKIKSVIRVYEKTAAHPRFGFYGNVTVGHEFAVEELRRFYDAIVFTTGAETDRRLDVPGEELAGSHTATEFVAWYNGHPDYRDRSFDLSQEAAVIIGVGNVAMDVCRILCKTVEELEATDIARPALDALAASRVRTVHLVGRRGPGQAAFTPPEIREFGALEECDPVIDPALLKVNPETVQELLDPANGDARRNIEVLREYASRPPPWKRRRFVIHFLESPVELRGTDRLSSVVLERNRLAGPPGAQKAAGTGERTEVPCGLLFRSVGYRGVRVPGVPFDEKRGVIPNEKGRVLQGGSPVPGLYAAGWIKRGPTGVIGTNKADAAETAASLLADAPSLPPCPIRDPGAPAAFLRERGIRFVDYAGWKNIDAAEIARGAPAGKPREKFLRVEEMLEAAG